MRGASARKRGFLGLHQKFDNDDDIAINEETVNSSS